MSEQPRSLHEEDPVENLCMEFRVALGGHWSDHPCRCAEVRIAFEAGAVAERERVTRIIRELVWTEPNEDGWGTYNDALHDVLVALGVEDSQPGEPENPGGGVAV